jgi:hypothetical protein
LRIICPFIKHATALRLLQSGPPTALLTSRGDHGVSNFPSPTVMRALWSA